jgi:hypothetical protein
MRSLSMVAVLLLGGVSLAGAPVARAGEWAQVTCAQPNGEPAPIDGWRGSSLNGYGPDSGPSNTCGQLDGALTAFDSSAAEGAAYTGPMWVYTAPTGSMIAGGSLTVSLSTPQGEAYVATPKNEYAQGDVLVNCQFNEPCSNAIRTVPITFPGGTQLFMAALCVGPFEGATTCPAGSGGGTNAEISLYAADVELETSSTPTGTSFAGSLLAPAASGTAALTLGVGDPEGPGVYRVTVDLDATAVYHGTPDSNGGRCASIGVDAKGVSEFLYAQPCKRAVELDVPVDTTKFSNGQHQLKVTVQDAAGNTADVYDGTISISNPSTGGAASSGVATSPIGPGSSLALRGPANGTNVSDQAKLTARWTGTAKATRTSGYGQADRVLGRLTTSAGRPIFGAILDAYETPAGEGAKTVTLASARTGPTGAWSLTLPKGISSSALRIDYRSHMNDTIPVATATLTLRVHAGIKLRIEPHVTSAGHRIAFTGVLRGAPIPQGGKQLVLEASSGGEWVQFETIATDGKGRYRASYRFKFPGPATYRFRVYSPQEADFPFIDGSSNIVDVYER